MAGHSKWANIKRQKARVDAKKGKIFAGLSRAIIVAARQGVPDPEGNFQLRSAIDKAKAAGIPNENIERAIAKGSGQLGPDGDAWEEIRYEGYGPSGVAILIEALTDNRNRTAADLRATFTKRSGNLGESGCVSWMFNQIGVITVSNPPSEDEFLEIVLDLDVDTFDFFEDDDQACYAEVYTNVGTLDALAQSLKDANLTIIEAELRWIPQNTIDINEPNTAKELIRLIEQLEELDDVQSVTANFDLPDSLM